jgi:hypothetical protein
MYPNYPQSLTLIRGTNQEIDRLEFWVVPAGCVLPDYPGQNWSDRFSPVGCHEEFWARKSLLCYGCYCSKEERFLRQVFSQKGFWGVSGQNWPDRFAKSVWPVSPTCVRLSQTEAVWPVSETGLTGLGCQQLCRVCFCCVCRVVVGWVLLLGPVALQWLCGLGRRSLWMCTSEIGFIGRILE